MDLGALGPMALGPVAVVSGFAMGGISGRVIGKITGCAIAEPVGAALGAVGSLAACEVEPIVEMVQNANSNFNSDVQSTYSHSYTY